MNPMHTLLSHLFVFPIEFFIRNQTLLFLAVFLRLTNTMRHTEEKHPFLHTLGFCSSTKMEAKRETSNSM